MQKRLWILLLATIMMIGVCGCMKTNKDRGRIERNQKYAQQMLAYMEEKYDTVFQVVEEIFPESGINTGMKENVLVVKDSNGVLANAKARLGSPDVFYDDYVYACGADRIQRSLDLSGLQELGNARVYGVFNAKHLSEISIAPEEVPSVTLVVNLPQQVTAEAMEQLYDAYSQICDAGYRKLYLIAWFTDGSAEFDQAVENYRIYGKSNWTDYSGTVYAALKITEPGLSYDDFQAALTEN